MCIKPLIEVAFSGWSPASIAVAAADSGCAGDGGGCDGSGGGTCGCGSGGGCGGSGGGTCGCGGFSDAERSGPEWLGQRHALIIKGKRISCPPQYDHRDLQGVPRRLKERHCLEHGFPLIRSLRASAQWSTSVLFSFVLSFDCRRIIHHPAIKNGSNVAFIFADHAV